MQSLAEVSGGNPGQAPPVLRGAVAKTPSGSPFLPLHLSNLRTALNAVGKSGQAVELQRLALELLPSGHPDRAVVLGNLAAALGATGDDALVPEAMPAIETVVDDVAAPGDDRLLAAWRLADSRVRVAGGDAAEAASVLQAATELADRWPGSE